MGIFLPSIIQKYYKEGDLQKIKDWKNEEDMENNGSRNYTEEYQILCYLEDILEEFGKKDACIGLDKELEHTGEIINCYKALCNCSSITNFNGEKKEVINRISNAAWSWISNNVIKEYIGPVIVPYCSSCEGIRASVVDFLTLETKINEFYNLEHYYTIADMHFLRGQVPRVAEFVKREWKDMMQCIVDTLEDEGAKAAASLIEERQNEAENNYEWVVDNLFNESNYRTIDFCSKRWESGLCLFELL